MGERGHRWAGGPAIGSDTIVMSDPVYVGIAVTSHDAGAMTTAVADDLSVSSVLSPSNQLPTVSLAASVYGTCVDFADRGRVGS